MEEIQEEVIPEIPEDNGGVVSYINGKNIYELKFEDNVIDVYKNGKKTYIITAKTCSCSGFGFRKNCQHFEKAKSENLLSLIKDSKGFDFGKSPIVIKMREKAVRLYNEKNNFGWSENSIKFIINEMPKYIMSGKTLPDLIADAI